MQYNFFIHNDKLIFNDHVNPRTGSVNVYECVFNINESVKGLQWFCVFNTEGVNAIVTPIINNKCFIPVEVLKDEKSIDIGCYATNGNTEDFKRINTNWLTFRPTKGAYMEGEAPETPSPDFWETLIFKTVPYIGSNGNWFIYDMETGQYKDTGKPSSGTGGGGSVDLSNYYTKAEVDEGIKKAEDFANEIDERKLSAIVYYYGDGENPPSQIYEWFTFDDNFSIGMNSETFPKDLETLVIPYSDADGIPAKRIKNGGFRGLYNLKKIVIPRDVAKIGGVAFAECTSLTEIIFPNTIKEIGGSAFSQCRSLKNVVLPDGLEKIEEQAFSECDNLETITIPDTVKNIGDYIFLGCGQKINIIFKGSESQWKSVYPDNPNDYSDVSITFEGDLVTEAVIGDIDSALDAIIALQADKGGDAV